VTGGGTGIGRACALDVAVNSAGYLGAASMPSSEWTSEMLVTNVRGTFLPMKYELEVMQRQGSGAIVNIGSGAGLLGVPGHSGCVASKHAGIGLTPPDRGAGAGAMPARISSS
jgi:NAD(P)-dependent dehydrogenase (short-subunit alcohol dehydrogenase family)